jgi:hypothetical protein
MGFGLQNTGTFLPIIKINGKEGGVSRSTYDGTNRGEEIIEDFVALFDFATLKVGWIEFGDKGPDKRLVALGDPLPDCPGEKFKQGIEVIVYLPGGLGAHELCTTAGGTLSALEQIYDAALSSVEWTQNMVPVVRLTHFTKEKTKHGGRAIPSFEILDWKPRPAEMEQYRAVPKPRATLPSQQAQGNDKSVRPATGSTQITPPAAAAKKPVPEFG